jgi:hypothetical protein
MIRAAAVSIFSALILSFSPPAFSEEQIEYRQFKYEDASCDVGVRYRNTPDGVVLGVSAIATGKGSEFRKWYVKDVKLHIGDERFIPDSQSKFYVTEESFFRVPGAILFAAIGALGEYSANDFENVVGKIGVGLGLGLIALTAKGDITGERCLFHIPKDLAHELDENEDCINIVISNDDLHVDYNIKIGLMMPSGDTTAKYNFDKMDKIKVLDRIDSLKSEITALEEEQSNYKYGQDPQYDVIQRKVELLETERGIAYKAWFDKKDK